MKTFILHRNGDWYEGDGMSLCGIGIGKIFDDYRFRSVCLNWPNVVTLVVATKDPKKRGFIKLMYRESDIYRQGRRQYINVATRMNVIPLLGLSCNQLIWVKLTTSEK